MARITQKGQGSPFALHASATFQTSTDSALATLVGTRWDLSDGREVILVSTSSATAATAGYLYQDPALVSNHQNIGISAFSAYSSSTNTPAYITLGTNATAITANQYQGGYVVVNAGTGIGQTLQIMSNTAVSSSSTGTLYLSEAPNTSLSSSDSKICLIPPHGANVIINPTTPTNVPVGVALYNIAASTYGFMVTKGLTSSLSDSSVAAVGKSISPSVTTAGTTTLSTGTSAVIGYAAQTAVSAEARTVFVNL